MSDKLTRLGPRGVPTHHMHPTIASLGNPMKAMNGSLLETFLENRLWEFLDSIQDYFVKMMYLRFDY